MNDQTRHRLRNESFITQDPGMIQLLEMVERIAPSDVTTLIYGESGTGKELIAKNLHSFSQRAMKPLVSLNCGALQESLLLSELFGHEKGAFTGAVYQKKGLVEVAHGGTLFLDEIGEMGPQTQAKFLRFLQDGEIYRVGGKAPIQVNVRIVSATNKDLEQLVKEKKFREDLYYRVNTVTLTISPLRKRAHDVPLLMNHFISDPKFGRPMSINEKAMNLLQCYGWPGNVRELQNTAERFKILVDSDTITENDIPFNIKSTDYDDDCFVGASSFLLEKIEKRHIIKVLDHFRGNKTKAAKAMGITVKTLYNKLARYETARSLELRVH